MAKDEKKPRKELTKKGTNAVKNRTNNCPAKNLQAKPEDIIAKSKKLVEKTQKRKSSINSPRSFIRPKDHSKVCSNGKPMPPLSELERMYEDSDDDDKTKTGPSKINKSSSISSQKISTDKLTSPKTIKRITEKKIDFISTFPDPTTITKNDSSPPSPKKRKRSECQNHPQAAKTSSTKFRNSDDIDKIGSEDKQECPQKRAKKFKRDNIAAWLQDCEKGDNSDGSNDSNKTVDYDYTKTPPANIAKPFSPLPSTSKDRETMNKNDKLFNESLISEPCLSNNQSKINILNYTIVDSDTEIKPNEVKKEKEMLETCINTTNTYNTDDIELIQTPYETIVIDDEIVTNRPTARKYSNETDIIECIDIDESIIKKESTEVAGYNEAIVIDDEDSYKFINESPTHDEGPEVIDIDNIIAENKAIIEKYAKKSEKDINTVTCVDTTTITNLNTTNSGEPSISANTCDTTNIKRRDNIMSKSGESAHTQKNKNNNIKDIVTNYFSNNPHNQNQPREKVPRNAAGTSLWNRVTEWLDNLTPNYATNKRTTLRNRTQTADSSTDCVIVSENITSPALNNNRGPPEAPTTTHSPPRTNNFKGKQMRINGVVQSYTNSLQNPKVTLGSVEDIEYMNVYCSGDDLFITGSEDPPPGLDSSNLIHKRIPIRQIFEQQASLRRLAAAKSPSKTKSPGSSKNFGDCPICMDSLSNNSVASTICGHVFCMRCIEAAFKASGKRCPTCRKVLKKGGYHQLFL